jgi:hypothetical protein
MRARTFPYGVREQRTAPPPRRSRAAPGECRTCDEHRADPMLPPHDASPACVSGRRPHCTCDTCY